MSNREGTQICPMVSIIIPIYNTALNRLHNLLNSVLRQQVMECMEIILVDDGSTFEVAKTIDSFANKYENIRAFHTSNRGVSSARNLGINQAKGMYLAFADADDELGDDFLTEALELAQKYNADVVYGNLMRCKKVPNLKMVNDIQQYEYIFNEEPEALQICLLEYDRGQYPCAINGSPVGKLYRTQLVKTSLFPEGIAYFEDQIFNREFAKKVKIAVVTSKVWYFYVENTESAMFSAKKKIDFYKQIKPYWDYCYTEVQRASNDIKKASRIMGMNRFIALIQTGYLNADISLKAKLRLIDEAAKHPMVKDIVENLDFSDDKLSSKEKIKLKLLQNKKWLALYLLVKCLYNPYKNESKRV